VAAVGGLKVGRAVQRVVCDQPSCRHRLAASGLCSLPRVEMSSQFFEGVFQRVECASYEFVEDDPDAE